MLCKKMVCLCKKWYVGWVLVCFDDVIWLFGCCVCFVNYDSLIVGDLLIYCELF